MTDSLFPHLAEAPAHPPTPGALIAQVFPERRLDAPHGLSYLIPAHLIETLRPGDRVTIPLGRGDTPTPGLVVEVAPWRPDLAPRRDLKPILDSQGPMVPHHLISLARWIADYYICPFGTVIASMLPAPVRRDVGRKARRLLDRAHPTPDTALPPQAARAWEQIAALPDSTFPIEPADLIARLDLTTRAPINRLLRAGFLIETTRDQIAAIWREGEQLATPRPSDGPLDLSPHQRAAIDSIAASSGFAPFLLYGVTGSGKTEVYLQAIDPLVRAGRAAIVLVPEISLTPQTARRFLDRFHAFGVAILHSALTAAQRHQEWRRIAEGKALVVIGARSAVFAPIGLSGTGRLGIIIVDEEHDSSYKQDQAPRYHARDVAIKRAQIEGCPAVLGSATPSLESWRNAQPQGGNRYRLLELPERVTGAPLPRVRIVDMAEDRRRGPASRPRNSAIGPTLHAALQRTLDAGRQAILLLNRRGFANYIACPDRACGWILTCEDCDAAMVVHRDRLPPPGAPPAFTRCHHCRAERILPTTCPVCERRLITFGAGTQRLEAELEHLFPDLESGGSMVRLDSDSMRSARDYFTALDDFASGRIRILLGTQMIAKGLDFPNIGLVGVINADTATSMPDFRASERTFQLLAQVAGRAGRRRDEPSIVIFQTYQPSHRAIELAAKHDFPTFAREELELRERTNLPPATRMARILFRDPDQAKARAAAEAASTALTPANGVEVRGPSLCAMSRLSGEWRYELEIISPSSGLLRRTMSDIHRALMRGEAVIDIDPLSLL